MAIEKGKVVIAIETKYKGKGLSKTFINGAAAKIAENLDSEDDIEGKIDELDFLFTSAISEADRRVTDAVNKVKNKTPEKKDDVVTTTTDDEVDDPEMPAYMKKFMGKVEGLEKSIKAIQDEKTVNSITERFHKDERLKGLSPKILKGYIPTSDDDYEAAVELAAEELKEFISDSNDVTPPSAAGGKQSDKPKFGGKPGGGNKQDGKPATKEEVDAAVSKLVI